MRHRSIVSLLISVSLAGATLAAPPAAAVAAGTTDRALCSQLSSTTFSWLNTATSNNFLTLSSAAVAPNPRFTTAEGAAFAVATQASSALLPVHGLYRAKTHDYLYSTNAGEWKSAQVKHGYVDQGVAFYAAGQPNSCLQPVYRYMYKGRHRLTTDDAARRSLAARKAVYEGVAFYASPLSRIDPSGSDPFTIAVVPPTQQEVLRSGDKRWLNRANWLVDNKNALNLRFVTDTGDVSNWGNVDRHQLAIVSAATAKLEAASIPYSLALGNHDTAAVCVGGGACDPKKTRVLFRDTTAFNRYFTAQRFGAVAGEFEPGKVDNSYSTFSAGNTQWMVMTLEMWPRRTAVAWAKSVVAAHPHHNVIIVTHQYLTGSGGIDTHSEYGETSPKYLFDQLIRRYPNVKIVLSGHVGSDAHRTDRGTAGNTIYSLSLHMHDQNANPIRLLTIDPEAGTLKSRVYSPNVKRSYPSWDRTISGITWIR